MIWCDNVKSLQLFDVFQVCLCVFRQKGLVSESAAVHVILTVASGLSCVDEQQQRV